MIILNLNMNLNFIKIMRYQHTSIENSNFPKFTWSCGNWLIGNKEKNDQITKFEYIYIFPLVNKKFNSLNTLTFLLMGCIWKYPSTSVFIDQPLRSGRLYHFALLQIYGPKKLNAQFHYVMALCWKEILCFLLFHPFICDKTANVDKSIFLFIQ